MGDTDVIEATAAAVRAEAARQRISGVALAKRLGVSQAWMSRRLGGRQPFDIGELARVAEALDVPLSRLVPDAQDTSKRAS
jgi:transcriptional regulator with XRE-family HTH domain